MDKDFWAARISAVMRQSHAQHPWGRLSIDDLEVEEEGRIEFPCPYCFEEFDISTLCTHLEEEHIPESKGVACPVCGSRILKDIVGHITFQHGHLFKSQRRRRLRRNALLSSGSSSYAAKELREAQLHALLANGGFRSNIIAGGNAVDSLFSPLVNFLPSMGCEESVKKNSSVEEVAVNSNTPAAEHKFSDPFLSAEELEERVQQATSRAKFVQQLVLSTLLEET